MRRVSLASLDAGSRRSLTRRSAVPDQTVLDRARDIVADVRSGGDEALNRLGRRLGGCSDGPTLVDPSILSRTLLALEPDLRTAIESAIANVTTVHEPQRPTDASTTSIDGVTVERVWSPLRSVGVYVPGGRAVYPSSMIMGVVPALIAGVDRIVVATPAGPGGVVDPLVLATAAMLGVDEVHAMGGAQAIAALAYGTETIAAVDKIVGPGGPWVTAAKLAVAGAVGIDLPAGPSEAAVIADASADIAAVAADVMCQAEHGTESAIVVVVDDATIADAIEAEIASTVPSLARRAIIEDALTRHGCIAVAPSIRDGLAFIDEWAPEHLSIHTTDARADADLVRNAGSVFIGRWTPEAAGDYATGANHVLPTGGLARAYGPLGVEDFGSWRQIQTVTEDGLRSLAPTITDLANAEGLTAHAWSVTVRLGVRR